jgi:hypothetical protein
MSLRNRRGLLHTIRLMRLNTARQSINMIDASDAPDLDANDDGISRSIEIPLSTCFPDLKHITCALAYGNEVWSAMLRAVMMGSIVVVKLLYAVALVELYAEAPQVRTANT